MIFTTSFFFFFWSWNNDFTHLINPGCWVLFFVSISICSSTLRNMYKQIGVLLAAAPAPESAVHPQHGVSQGWGFPCALFPQHPLGVSCAEPSAAAARQKPEMRELQAGNCRDLCAAQQRSSTLPTLLPALSHQRGLGIVWMFYLCLT